jgi:hypothetical protein
MVSGKIPLMGVIVSYVEAGKGGGDAFSSWIFSDNDEKRQVLWWRAAAWLEVCDWFVAKGQERLRPLGTTTWETLCTEPYWRRRVEGGCRSAGIWVASMLLGSCEGWTPELDIESLAI